MEKDKGSCGTTGSCGTPSTGSCGTPTAGSCGTGGGKEKCCGKMFLGALLGGIVMFAWISISWMLLPLHKNDVASFKDEKAVATAIGKNISGDGTYVIPYTNMGKDKAKTDKPYAYVVVKADGVDVTNMNPQLLKEFGLCFFLAAMLGCLLKKTAGCGCCPVLISCKVGLLAGLAAYIPNYIWFHFPLNGALVGVFETVVGFMLAGLVIAKCVFKMPIGKAACGMGACGTK